MAQVANPASSEFVGALLDLPALPPPPGVVPNLIDPYSDAYTIIIALTICLAFTTVFVWMRMYTVFFITKLHGWADYTSLLAWALLVGYCAMGYDVIPYGGGVHQWNVTIRHASTYAKISNAIEIYYCIVIFITKLSILLQFRQIFDPARSGSVHYIIHALIWLNLLFYTAIMFPQIFECAPRNKIWQPWVPGHCLSLPDIFFATASINTFSDFSILLLPMYNILRLQMRARRKLGLLAIFAVGLLACISSVMRLVTSVMYVRNPDATYTDVPTALWSVAEISSGILAGCLPVMPGFFNRFAPSFVGKFSPYYQSFKDRTSSTKSSTPGNRATFIKPTAPWNESQLLKDSDQESGVGHELGPLEIGTKAPSLEAMNFATERDLGITEVGKDLEIGKVEHDDSRIMKTVVLDQNSSRRSSSKEESQARVLGINSWA